MATTTVPLTSSNAIQKLTFTTLPLEIRDQVYKYVFANLLLHPFRRDDPQYQLSCERCVNAHVSSSWCKNTPSGTSDNQVNDTKDNHHDIDSQPYNTAFQPLLTCKQIYHEASPLFFSTATLQISTLTSLRALSDRTARLWQSLSPTTLNLASHKSTLSSLLPQQQQEQPKHLTQRETHRLQLVLHFNDDNYREWCAALDGRMAAKIFSRLEGGLVLVNHMRSPTSYERLVDAVYFCAPIVKGRWGQGLRYVPPVTVSSSSSSSLSSRGAPPTATTSSSSSSSGTPQAAKSRETEKEEGKTEPSKLQIHLAYTRDEIMFESPLLGSITTADSFEAHESVIRDLLVDEAFVVAAQEEKFEVMTARLLSVARGHEESWLEGLQRRRLGGLTVREVQERFAAQRNGGGAGGEGGMGQQQEAAAAAIAVDREVIHGEAEGGEGNENDDRAEEEDSEDERDENGWTAEDWERYRLSVEQEHQHRT